MKEMFVTKRNGTVVPYDKTRIKNAIMHSVRATKSSATDDQVNEIVENVETEIYTRFVDIYPNVENVQDIVEKHLIKSNLYDLAKEYILYRADRQKQREQEKKDNAEKTLLGKMTIKKQDGRAVLFDMQKVKKTLERAIKGYEKDVSVDLIQKELLKNIYDGLTTHDLEKALVLAATAYVERDPAYSKVAARIFLQKLYKEILQKSVSSDILGIAYRETFIDNIKLAVKKGYLDERLLDFDLQKLSWGLKIERDSKFEFIGIQTLYERYFIKDHGKQLELPQAFFMRVAMGLALNEKDKEEKALEFYEVLSSFRFMTSTPTLFHSGTSHPQLSSCYLTTVEDDLKNIFKAYSDNAQLSKWSGGLGNDWTNIRGTGAWIKTTNVESQGVIPFLKIANDVTAAINRSGKRRGATCAYLETWHYDIEEFLDLRKNTGDDRRRTHDMNTANWIPDLFMKRVREDGEWTLFSPDETPDLHHIYGSEFERKYIDYEAAARNGQMKKYKIVSAKKIWRKMISMLFETGHPWITFKDPCNVRSPQDHVGVVHNSNLCTEITLNTSKDEVAVCNLGSINLPMHVKEVEGEEGTFEIDKKLLQKTVRTAIRMLDNVIDVNYYPIPEAKNSNMKHRPIGLGLMGVQDMFYKLDLPFDSQAAFKASDETMEFISYHAIMASSELAGERGSYDSFKGSKWDRGIMPLDTVMLLEKERGEDIPVSKASILDWTEVRAAIKKNGMRNSNVMAVAPTATISTIVGSYPCIEPIYKNIYVKANMTGEFTIVNAYLVKDLKELNLWGDEMVEQLKYYDGNISMIAGIPEHLKAKYKEVFEIDYRALIKHTALRAKWIDQSQSHNIFIKGTSGKQFSDAYMYAWEMGLKTTYYLRTLGASQIEKSTLDAKKYGYTQKREYTKDDEKKDVASVSVKDEKVVAPASQVGKVCSLMDPDCEACQ